MTRELFEGNLLRNTPEARGRVDKSLRVAGRYILDARRSFEIESYIMTVIAAYSSMFHAARTVLFADGVSEKSHYAVYEYLKEAHPELGMQVIEGFNLYRKMRHAAMYELDAEVSRLEAGEAINFADAFLKQVANELEK